MWQGDLELTVRIHHVEYLVDDVYHMSWTRMEFLSR